MLPAGLRFNFHARDIVSKPFLGHCRRIGFSECEIELPDDWAPAVLPCTDLLPTTVPGV